MKRSGLPAGSDSRESACNMGDTRFNPWVGKSPWRRDWQLTPVFLPGEFHGQRSLAGYSPWHHKESDMTERLTLSLWKDQLSTGGPAQISGCGFYSAHFIEDSLKLQQNRKLDQDQIARHSMFPMQWARAGGPGSITG